jgi:nitroimidazol reductase NimA-like FMN-containing flavoprotein (pyridoxamine 5'-phosphate oxidase superfamily)
MPKKFLSSIREMEKLLSEERVGYLGICAGNRPYVILLTYGYAEGKIIFHGAVQVRKLDMIRENPNVCFTVSRHFGEMAPHPQGARCHVNSDSVICCGKARVVDDIRERRRILNVFNRRLQPDAGEVTEENVRRCSAVEITVEEMTGRTEWDSKCTYWRCQAKNAADPPE